MKVTEITETVRYTINTSRFIDGECKQGTMTATVTQAIENYRDFWTGQVHATAYRFEIQDSLTGVTTMAVLPEDEFAAVWMA